MQNTTDRAQLSRWALLSIAAALVTMALKVIAWQITGSVGLLSDAAESLVNLTAAVVAFVALWVAARPPDDSHQFGHAKAEYFSAIIEGLMILIAAAIIIASAVERLLHPRELETVGVGLAVSTLAGALNGLAGWALVRAGRRHRSIALQADGRHLLTDVWTTVGVVIGVALVALTGWLPLDALIAIAVAVNILYVGYGLIRRSVGGLMDAALDAADQCEIERVLDGFRSPEVDFHDVRTRQSGWLRFVTLHALVPGDWTVRRGHDLAEQVQDALTAALPDLRVVVHVEPVDDPRSYEPWRRR
ncbi:cation diffusion facilitator family transporter [Gordonia sp. VNK21]|uniref:cation diffusion facilitator family transporter n=1 Tax=Gordonia sp. VNK21 TaxID=3382483 RepID=UPI0038D397E0